MPLSNTAITLHATTVFKRRHVLTMGANSAVSLLMPCWARAQETWPQLKPIQLIVPWPAGGATDLTLRILCEEAEPHLGQKLIIMNKPGAAGTLVMNSLKAAEPDGYTLGQIPITIFRHALSNKVNWDPLKDISPILQVSGVNFGVLVPAQSPWQTWADLVAWAKSHPGELTVGSTGIGSTPHLAMQDVLTDLGIRYVHVPYKGTADHMLALASGQIMMGVNSTGFAPWVDQGKLRLLGVFDAQRNPRWPKTPTLRELGFADAVYQSPWGLAAPNGTPLAVINRLHDVFRKAMQSQRFVQALGQYDQTLDYLNTLDYQHALKQTSEQERKLLQRLDLLK